MVHTYRYGSTLLVSDVGFLLLSKASYWERIKPALALNSNLKKIKNGETISYNSRTERLNKSCGGQASFVKGILKDISTYVHSIPPDLWFKSLKSAFDNTSTNKEFLEVWLQLANFFYANSIRAINKLYNTDLGNDLINYLNKYHKPFNE